MVTDIARILQEKPACTDTLREVLGLIAGILPVDAAALYLHNKSTGTLEETASAGRTIDLLDFVQFDQGSGLAGWAAKQNRPIFIPGHDPESHGVREHHDSIMILPLLVAGELMGVLCFCHRTREAFDTNRRKLMELAAEQVAISLERIMHRKELENKNSSLARVQTQLKEARSQLIAQEKLNAVAELAASINHEISNPLSAIIGNAQIIELEAATLPPELHHRIEAIVDAAKRISLITHKLLKIDSLVRENYLSHETKTTVKVAKVSGS